MPTLYRLVGVNVMSVLMQLSILMLMVKLMLILMLMLVISEHLMLVFHFGHLSLVDNAHFCFRNRSLSFITKDSGVVRGVGGWGQCLILFLF